MISVALRVKINLHERDYTLKDHVDQFNVERRCKDHVDWNQVLHLSILLLALD